jgi:hypothetical protein
MASMRLLPLVTLMLYAGPLVAGMAGYGWAMVVPFAAIFVLWQIVMRPLDWPRQAAPWARRELQAAALARVVLMVILVALCFAVGRGIGGLVGYMPAVPLALPLGASVLAIPLARLLAGPADPATHRFLNEALAAVDAAASPDAAHLAAAAERAGRLIDPLADLPADTGAETVATHLTALAPHVDPAQLRRALLARVKAGDGGALPMALALHATDPGALAALKGDEATFAFMALPDDSAVLAAFARRAAAALAADPGLWWGMPSDDTLAARIAAVDGTEAEGALRELLATARRVAPDPARG